MNSMPQPDFNLAYCFVRKMNNEKTHHNSPPVPRDPLQERKHKNQRSFVEGFKFSASDTKIRGLTIGNFALFLLNSD